MGHSRFVKDGVIHGMRGTVEHIGTSEDGDKYYAVIAKCGHVGYGYFLPVCFAVEAKDLSSAIQITKERSRVQRDHKDCILAASEISAQEYYLINLNNDHDAYLKTNYANEDFGHIERRRIISPELLQDVLNNKEYRVGFRGIERKIPSVEEIKTADKYLDYQSLQKAFAPSLYGDKYVYPTRVNVRELLDKYLADIAVFQGILKKREHPLILYYQIFGEGNELGLTYSYGSLRYRSLNGKTVYVPVSDGEREHIENSKFVRAKKQEETIEPVETVDVKIPSALDKFQRRLQKHQEFKDKTEKKESQPGE